jgi:hypothetical protein
MMGDRPVTIPESAEVVHGVLPDGTPVVSLQLWVFDAGPVNYALSPDLAVAIAADLLHHAEMAPRDAT